MIDVVSNLNALAAPILKEFKTLENEDVLEILNQYYNLDLSPSQMLNYVAKDAKRNFTTRKELVCRVIRKHNGLPETPGMKLYPADQNDEEINKRIQDMVLKRATNPDGIKRSEKIIRRKIITIAIHASKLVNAKNGLELEIKKRCKLTGMTREEVERSLYCAYFQIGVK